MSSSLIDPHWPVIMSSSHVGHREGGTTGVGEALRKYSSSSPRPSLRLKVIEPRRHISVGPLDGEANFVRYRVGSDTYTPVPSQECTVVSCP